MSRSSSGAGVLAQEQRSTVSETGEKKPRSSCCSWRSRPARDRASASPTRCRLRQHLTTVMNAVGAASIVRYLPLSRHLEQLRSHRQDEAHALRQLR